jgi:hypothetical protein
MKVSVQTDNLKLFREALKSGCSSVRLGSEFCEHLLPTLAGLERVYELAHEEGKEFTYVTPRLSNAGIERLKEQLPALNEKGEVEGRSSPTVVVNDFGALNVLQHYPNLRPHLGRNLFLVPARSAWGDRHVESEDISTELGGWLNTLYSTTSLNYQATIELYRSYGCQRVDVDWVPRILPSLRSLVEKGLSLSVHLHLVPVTFTRKCHMARFLAEESPETCSMPCLRRAFVLKNEALKDYGLDFYLGGNTVFRLVQPSSGDILDLENAGVSELVLTLNPITRIDTARKIDDLISDLALKI